MKSSLVLAQIVLCGFFYLIHLPVIFCLFGSFRNSQSHGTKRQSEPWNQEKASRSVTRFFCHFPRCKKEDIFSRTSSFSWRENCSFRSYRRGRSFPSFLCHNLSSLLCVLQCGEDVQCPSASDHEEEVEGNSLFMETKEKEKENNKKRKREKRKRTLFLN